VLSPAHTKALAKANDLVFIELTSHLDWLA